MLDGHGELTLGTLGLTNAVSNENYEVKELNLLTEKAVPADAEHRAGDGAEEGPLGGGRGQAARVARRRRADGGPAWT